jgi:putative transcriptional regulator
MLENIDARHPERPAFQHPHAHGPAGNHLMAVVVKLDELLHARRMTLTDLATRVDITLANLSILKTGKAKAIRFSTLEAICRELQCQPGDLLQFEAG